MRMRQRGLLTVAVLLAVGLAVSGCSTFDPTEWFSQKKPLPGERKAVFPQGVPGVAQGVPPELVQGYTPPVEPVPEPKVVEEKPKPKPRVAARPKPAPKPAQAVAPRPAPAAAAPQQQGAQAPWPEAPPARSAPAPAQSQSVFPDPPPPAR
jgi:hypothetical protein